MAVLNNPMGALGALDALSGARSITSRPTTGLSSNRGVGVVGACGEQDLPNSIVTCPSKTETNCVRGGCEDAVCVCDREGNVRAWCTGCPDSGTGELGLDWAPGNTLGG